MRVRFLFPALFRVGNPVVDVRSTDEVYEIGVPEQEDFLARYTEGTHYEVVVDAPPAPVEPPAPPADPEPPAEAPAEDKPAESTPAPTKPSKSKGTA